LGQRLLRETLHGSRAAYGKRILVTVSRELTDEYGRGFSYAELAHVGQMEFYLRWLDKYERAPGEDAPIGLILCAGADAEQVELLELDARSIRVAEYLTELPPVKLLRQRLHRTIEHAREHANRSAPDDGTAP
jgi:hypothetical protein